MKKKELPEPAWRYKTVAYWNPVHGALKDNVSFFVDPWSLPKEPRFYNYVTAWQEGIQGYMLNSVFITVLTIVIVILISCAFSFMVARFPFKGGNLLVSLFFAGMMIPVHCTLIPLYSIMNRLGWVDHLIALLFPYVASSIPMTVFLTYGHYQQLPKELEEAATIDGCSIIQMFVRIFLPLAKPVISTSTILTAIGIWNEFIFSYTLTQNKMNRTLPLAIWDFQGAHSMNAPMIMAVLTITTIPMLILFAVFQEKLMDSMTIGAVKG